MKPIDEIFLPKSSKNEELEDLSRKKIAPLFDEERFILKGEIIDNGIDMRNEIKMNSMKLGFGFNFQLKSKIKATSNSDGSYSKSIETKNIEYLLNNGQPAFYGFYIKNEDKFYYIHLNEVIQKLNAKDPNWENQPNHTIRFEKVLSPEAINEIYQISIKHGTMLRELNFRGALMINSSSKNQKIIVDYQENVTDDNEIRTLIEGLGHELINEGRWKEIIHVHRNASGEVAKTPKYCLIIGIAYYYNGQLFDALSYFKKSNKLRDELEKTSIDFLDYYFHTTKFSVGLIDEKSYNSEIQKLKDNPVLNFYISIEDAKNKYYTNPNPNEESFEELQGKIQSIIDNPNSSLHLKFLCRCELLYHNGIKKNSDYVRSVSFINAIESTTGPNLELRTESAKEFLQVNKDWFQDAYELKKEAFDSNSVFVYYLALINEAKIIYQLEAFTDYVFITAEISENPDPSKPDNSERIEQLLKQVEASNKFFSSIEHTENIIASLSLKYELLKYRRKENEANTILAELEGVVSEIDSPDIKRRFDYLKNNGTTHETFYTHMQGIKSKVQEEKREYERLVQIMEKMDEEEKEFESNELEKYHVNLFPIGYFEFPKPNLSEVLTFLNIDNEIKDNYKYLFEYGVVPICNLFYNPILKEGINDGYLGFRGVENWKRIYEVRKFFFENKFKRIENYC